MPKYKYRCVDCDAEYMTHHSIKEKMHNCAVCGTTDSLIRTPGTFVSETGRSRNKQVGSIVKEKIEEFREDLKKQKQRTVQETHE